MSLAVSIVSHGHAREVRELLALLARSDSTLVRRVWVTLNTPEPFLDGDPSLHGNLDVRVIRNARPKGFGANHNQAFAQEWALDDCSRWFVVMNPDISWDQAPWASMVECAEREKAGCVFPLQRGPHGEVQDHRRRLPTPTALMRRHGLLPSGPTPSEAPDWVNAALLLFPSNVYQQLKGFDESYFMYCEDVDICLRLQLMGYRLVEAQAACVTHVASRASRRNALHLLWHVRSLLRLWGSVPYQHYLDRLVR